jgi:hypothetical protein
MIKSFKLFLESKQSITYEMLSEIIQFRNNSLLNSYRTIHNKVDNLIELLGEDLDSLCTVTSSDYKKFLVDVENLVTVVNSDPQFVEQVQEIYTEVESILDGFPKFYELEDYFLELLDDGFNIQFTFTRSSFEILVSNGMSDVKLDYESYGELLKTCDGIQKRLNSRYDCDIIDASFTRQGDRKVADVTFELTKK